LQYGGKKGVYLELGPRKVLLLTIEKKPSILHLDDRKDALRIVMELARLQAQGCKSVNFFERLCFEKRVPGHPANTGPSREMFPCCGPTTWLLPKLVADLDTVKAVLVCRHADCKSSRVTEASTQI
jgi:hypothetical protein